MSIDVTAPPLDLTAGLTTPRGTDYYLLADLLTDEEREIRDRVRAFVDSDVLPIINDYWERAQFPFELVPKIAELGVVGGPIQGYGCPGLSRLAPGHGHPGTVPRRRQRQHLPRGAERPGHGVDQHARLRGAEAALAAGDGPAGEGRRIRTDRARPRLRFRRPGNHRPPGRRPLGAQRRQAVDRQRQHRARGDRLGPGRRRRQGQGLRRGEIRNSAGGHHRISRRATPRS